ncbi:GldG family protein [Anaerosporobacter sp.]
MSEKNTMKERFKQSFTNRKFKQGAYSSLITTIVVVVILIANMIVSELDLKVDVSSEKLYTLTDATKDFVKDVDHDITIYYIAESGNEVTMIKRIVDKYNNLSDNVKVVTKDPVLYPKFTSQYVDASTEVADNSIIVVDETNGRSKYIPYSDMLIQSMDYYSYSTTVTGIDVEGQITSAIQYVVSEDLPTMYAVQGHGEAEISTTLASYLTKQNVNQETLNTLSAESIPEDCSFLLLNGPVYDYTDDETEMIMDYLKNGGKAIILPNYMVSTEDMPNFNSILNYYGVSLVDSYVIEGDSNYHMSQMPTYLIPEISSHDITNDVKSDKKPVVVPATKGIEIMADVRSTLTIEELLNTSDKAYAKTDINSQVYDQEDTDVAGPFSLGVAITETIDDVETKVVVYASNYLLDESMISYAQLGNTDLILSTINWMADVSVETLAIPTKTFDDSYVTLSSAQSNSWSVFVILIIPGAFILTGVVVWLRRRKR